MKRVQQSGIEPLVVVQDEVELFKIFIYKSSMVLSEDGSSVEDEVVPFDVEGVVLHEEALLVEVVLDDEGHVTVGEVDEVAEDHPVLGTPLHAVACLEAEFEVLGVEVANFEAIALKLTLLPTINNIVLFHNVGVTVTVLEEQGVTIDVETINLMVLSQVPNDHTIRLSRLPDADTHDLLVAARSHSLDPGLGLILRDVQGQLLYFSGGQVQLPDMAEIVEEDELVIH
mmetsp:Transcript_7702/g.11944  ORF Transcript_7702/g.11944 Transcript_7702/m.11944 type:complete len:228 (+) Transcript_7702:1473-2156(+)